MMPVVVPILASAASGLAGYFVGSRRQVIKFQDRGWAVKLWRSGSNWKWTATRDGSESGSGTGGSNLEALDLARVWITAMQVKGAVEGIVDAAGQLVDAADSSSGSGSSSNGSDAMPFPLPRPPLGPVVEPPSPGLGRGLFPTPTPLPAPPLKTLRGGGIYWRPATNVITLYDLAEFVRSAFTLEVDPYTTDPRKIVEVALQAALPKLPLAAYGDTMLITTALGNQITLDEASMVVGQFQVQLHDETLGEEVPAFALDILHEAIFDIEQQQDVQPFAFRGRMLYARAAVGGYLGAIVQDDVVSYTATAAPTVADALQSAISLVREKDGI